MTLNFLDIFVFLAFVVAVISIGILKSRHEKTSEDYFLAGRGLSWWLIGGIIAALIVIGGGIILVLRQRRA